MTSKTRVGILFGGRSAEHEVSLQSAKSIIDAIDHHRYEVVMIGIDKHGSWYRGDPTNAILDTDNPKQIHLGASNDGIALVPGKTDGSIIHSDHRKPLDQIDVVFPVLHGTYGEDGTVQGMLKLAGIPFVGAGVLGSAIGMDKDVTKRLLREADIPIAEYMCVTRQKRDQLQYADIVSRLGTPFFIKPANLGSSVGISKVHDRSEFDPAVESAFRFDHKVLLEQYVDGREIECAVLGNEAPIASVPGEIIPQGGFYSYEAKYIDEEGAVLEIPAKVTKDTEDRIRDLAVEVFQVLCCEGMARVDFFLRTDGSLVVNELNSIPGFTSISMYPKLFEVTGIPYGELISRLIELAIERHNRDKLIHTDYD